jgi:tRNA-specific 2-thiouridylase
VTVGTREELAVTEIPLRDAVLHRDPARVTSARVRYHSKPLECRVVGEGHDLHLALAEPSTGPAPGQTAALMDGDLIVGHATIA